MDAHYLVAEIRRFFRETRVPGYATVPGEIKPDVLHEIVDEIFSFYLENPPFYDDSAPLPLQISGTWRSLLTQKRPEQLRAIAEFDRAAYERLLNGLFQSELMSGLWNYGSRRERGLAPDFMREIRTLKVETGFALADLCVGEPYPSMWGYPVDGRPPHVISHVGPSHCRQATHVRRALDADFISPKKTRPVVLDLGSGFGGMENYLLNSKDVGVDVVLLDIPLNLTTAYAYLRVTNPSKEVVLVKNREELERLAQEPPGPGEQRAILVPTILAREVARIFPPDLLHNAQSLSEMSRETIRFYLETLVTPGTQLVIESNVSDSVVTLNSGTVEVGSGEIAEMLEELGLTLLVRNIRDSGARYVVSTHVRSQPVRRPVT